MIIQIDKEKKRADTNVMPILIFVESERNLTIGKVIDVNGKVHEIRVNEKGKTQMT